MSVYRDEISLINSQFADFKWLATDAWAIAPAFQRLPISFWVKPKSAKCTAWHWAGVQAEINASLALINVLAKLQRRWLEFWVRVTAIRYSFSESSNLPDSVNAMPYPSEILSSGAKSIFPIAIAIRVSSFSCSK